MLDCMDMPKAPRQESGRTLFARRLIDARKARGLSQYELAALAGVSRSLVARLETGALHPLIGRFDSMVRLSRTLKVSLDSLADAIELEHWANSQRKRP